MRTRLVYDLPTRLFHWLFAGLFIGAFVIANTVDDDSPVFAYHMLAGLTLVFAVVLRIVWGFVGTRNARFDSFPLRPKQDLLAYFKGIFGKGESRSWGGHNPASSWAAVLMVVLALGLGITGYLMASCNDRDAYKEIHELLANAFLAVVLLHLAGIALHVLRHRDGFPFSMVNGYKQRAEDVETITGTRPLAGVVFAALIAVFAVNLARNYDPATQSLSLFGAHLQLGDSETGERREAQDADRKSGEDEG
jgi:cytochrome b